MEETDFQQRASELALRLAQSDIRQVRFHPAALLTGRS